LLGAVLAPGLTLLTGTAADAVPITGNLSFGGSVNLTSTHDDFLPAGGTTGSFTVMAPSTGNFAPLTGSNGTILDLDRSTSPVGGSYSIGSYLTFASAPTIRFDLTSIDAGVFTAAQLFSPPAPGQTATPTGTQFNFINTSASSSILSFSVHANAVNTTTNEVTPYTGVFTAQFADQSYQSVWATLSTEGNVTTAYSANFTPVVPEPATAGIICVLGTLVLTSRRR
jgi:hypothetical protein